MMLIANKGVNFKADIWTNVYWEFTSTQNGCNRMIIISLKVWFNFGIKINKERKINKFILRNIFKNLFLLYVNMQWFVNVIK